MFLNQILTRLKLRENSIKKLSRGTLFYWRKQLKRSLIAKTKLLKDKKNKKYLKKHFLITIVLTKLITMKTSLRIKKTTWQCPNLRKKKKSTKLKIDTSSPHQALPAQFQISKVSYLEVSLPDSGFTESICVVLITIIWWKIQKKESSEEETPACHFTRGSASPYNYLKEMLIL